MRICPRCHKRTIPWLHAYITTKWGAPIVCSNCKARLKCVFDMWYAISIIPTAAVAEMCNIWDVHPIKAIYFLIVFSGIFGLSLGEHTIRYVEVGPSVLA